MPRAFSVVLLLIAHGVSMAQLGDIHLIRRAPLPMAAGDLNGDTYPESIAVENGGVSVWDLSGPPVELSTSPGTLPPGAVEKWVLEDVDGDGLKDLVAAGQQVFILMGLPGFSFDPAVTLVSTAWPVNDLFFTDIDGDLLPDLVLVQASPLRTVHWAKNLGGGSYGATQLIGTGTASCGPRNFGLNTVVAIADLDGDLDQDIVLQAPTLTTFLNNGSGVFSAQTIGGLNGNTMAMIDMNGDLLPDVLAPVPGQGVRWQQNLGGGAFAAPAAAGVNEYNGIDGITTCDWNGDGLEDLIIQRPASICFPAALTVAANIGAMTLGSESACGTDFIILIGLAIGQVDGDPGEEVLWTGGKGLHVNGTMVIPYVGATSAAVVDLDQSGSPDVVLASGSIPGPYCSYVYQMATSYNDAFGNFSVPMQQAYSEEFGIRTVRAAQIDSDSLMDLVALTSSLGAGGPIVWYKGMAGGQFDSIAQITIQNDGMDPLMGDVDLDGDIDVVSLDGFYVQVHLNDGNGMFTTTMHSGNNGWPGPMCLADLDNDGDLDYVMAGNQLVWAPNDGLGVPGTEQLISSAIYGIPMESIPIRIADFDMNGYLDMVVVIPGFPFPNDDQLAVVLNNGGGSFQPATIWDHAIGGEHLSTIQVGDIDNDSYTDILTLHDSILGYYKNYGNGTFAAWDSLKAAVPGNELILVDMDGDGDMDVLTGPVWVENDFPFLATMTHVAGTQYVSMHPNPSDGNFSLISTDVFRTDDVIAIVDLNGRVLRTLYGNGTREVLIERGALASGMYLLRIMRGGNAIGNVRVVLHRN